MAWTIEDIDALKAAIAKGVQRVKYQDKEVTYHSVDDMLKALRLMEQELGVKAKGARVYAESGKGLC